MFDCVDGVFKVMGGVYYVVEFVDVWFVYVVFVMSMIVFGCIELIDVVCVCVMLGVLIVIMYENVMWLFDGGWLLLLLFVGCWFMLL